MRTISEDKQEVLLDLLKQLENDLCDVLNDIENDEEVSEEMWQSIDQKVKPVFYKITLLRDELYFS